MGTSLSYQSIDSLINQALAMEDMVRYAAEFGMTPSARVRLNGSGGGGAQENPFNAFKRPGRS